MKKSPENKTFKLLKSGEVSMRIDGEVMCIMKPEDMTKIFGYVPPKTNKR